MFLMVRRTTTGNMNARHRMVELQTLNSTSNTTRMRDDECKLQERRACLSTLPPHTSDYGTAKLARAAPGRVTITGRTTCKVSKVAPLPLRAGAGTTRSQAAAMETYSATH